MISIPLVGLFGVMLFFAMRTGYVGAIVAVIAVVFGFLLGGTSAAPTINHVLNTVKVK